MIFGSSSIIKCHHGNDMKQYQKIFEDHAINVILSVLTFNVTVARACVRQSIQQSDIQFKLQSVHSQKTSLSIENQ